MIRVPLTPAEVHGVTFGQPLTGRPGYDEDEVDAFLELIEVEMARLIEQNAALRDRRERFTGQRDGALGDSTAPPAVADAGPIAAQSPMSQPRPPGKDLRRLAIQVLGLAQQTADRLTEEAKTEAQLMLSNARTSAQQLLIQVNTTTEAIVHEATTRAQAILDQARTTANARDQQARENAAALERDAAQANIEVLAALDHRKNALENTIEELSAFEREYLIHYRMHLASQLRTLTKSGLTQPPDPAHNRLGTTGARGPSCQPKAAPFPATGHQAPRFSRSLTEPATTSHH